MARDNYQVVTMNLGRNEGRIADWSTVKALHPRLSGSEIRYSLVQKEAQAVEENDTQKLLEEILSMMKDVRTMLEASIEDGKELCSTTQEQEARKT